MSLLSSMEAQSFELGNVEAVILDIVQWCPYLKMAPALASPVGLSRDIQT